MKPIYHYTTADRLMMIFDSEKIIPATVGVMPPEIPAVWLSVSPTWENTATKGIVVDGIRRDATFEEMIEDTGSLVRIEIDPGQVRIIPPLKIRESLRMPRPTLDALTKAARAMGANPAEWRAVAGEVPLSAFLRIELCKESSPLRWVDAESLESGGD